MSEEAENANNVIRSFPYYLKMIMTYMGLLGVLITTIVFLIDNLFDKVSVQNLLMVDQISSILSIILAIVLIISCMFEVYKNYKTLMKIYTVMYNSLVDVNRFIQSNLREINPEDISEELIKEIIGSVKKPTIH